MKWSLISSTYLSTWHALTYLSRRRWSFISPSIHPGRIPPPTYLEGDGHFSPPPTYLGGIPSPTYLEGDGHFSLPPSYLGRVPQLPI